MDGDRCLFGANRNPVIRPGGGLLLVAIMLLSAAAAVAEQSTPEESSSATGNSSGPAADLNRGLVGFFPFEGNARDQSGHENHGTAYGLVAYDTGKVGQALQLSGIDDRGFITIQHSPSLTFVREASFACWYFINNDAGQTGENFLAGKVSKAHQVLVAKHGDIAGFSLLSLGEGMPHRQISMIGQNGTPTEVGATFPPDSPVLKWHHVATVADDDGVRLYHNGRLVSAVRGTLDFDRINRHHLFVGINGPAGNDSNPEGFLWFPLDGAIDELRIYNRALSHAEVRQLAGLNLKDDREFEEERILTELAFAAFSPEQATGLPDTPNIHDDAPSAWAAEMPDGPTEWLMLEYARPVKPKAAVVYEASNGGAVTALSVFDPDGKEINVWNGRTQRTKTRGIIVPSVLTFDVPFQTNRLRITLNPASCPGWNPIDAVGLREESGAVQWAVRATASSSRATAPAD